MSDRRPIEKRLGMKSYGPPLPKEAGLLWAIGQMVDGQPIACCENGAYFLRDNQWRPLGIVLSPPQDEPGS